MGIMNWIDDDEGGESASAEGMSADGGDDLFGDFDDGGGDDFGEMDDGFDDGGFDDDFGDMGGGDDFGGMGGDDMGGGNQVHQELENRVDGLENEVAEISSTINTVRSENEEISETVDEIEENVRKLLEIYEMVTRGVNPFVDDVQESGMGGSAFGGDFGLFEDDGEEEVEEDLDEDVLEAEAESFFDDDALDDFDEEDEDLEFEDDGLGEDAFDDGGTDDADTDDADGPSGASSFQELKAEYESGEADWAEESADGSVEVDAGDDEPEIDVEIEDDGADEAAVEEFEFDEPAEEPPANAGRNRSDGKPYLETLPSGYVVDLVVMEWLEFLIGEFGAEEAVRTIEYYERIEWISEPVAERLLAFLDGFADVDPESGDDLGPVELDIDDHIESLTFISQLTGDSMDRKIVDHCANLRGEGRGIQR